MASLSRPTLLVVGAGFLGGTVARQAKAGGWEVIPVVRSPESAAALRTEFPRVRYANALDPIFWSALPSDVDGLVWAMAPSRMRPEDNFEAMQRLGAVRAGAWAGQRNLPSVYISSTSVYSEEAGAWVNEDSPTASEDPRSQAMLEAEKAFLRAGGTVVRCAGLYGRERTLTPDGEGPERWLNLIHVDDAARAVGLALGQRGNIYNACEDEPKARGRPGGTWPAGGRRVRRNKRVRNCRLRSLGWVPLAG